jgi:hypothetical protein
MTDLLLSDFIDAWNAGRRPRVRDYLARLPDGPERDALADAITDWLSVAPAPAYPARVRAAIREEVAHAFELAGLRERAGFSVRELAQRLAGAFGFGDVDRAETYLLQLETGELDASRVSRRLLDALGGLLGATPAFRPAAGTLFRAEAADEAVRLDIELLSRAALSPAPAPMDDLDRLFTGGPDA